MARSTQKTHLCEPFTPYDFSLPCGDDQIFTLSEQQGHWVVLYFYPKDDTKGCTQEALDFNTLIDKFKALHAKIIGISPDTPKSHTKFKAKYNLDFPLLSDEDKTVSNSFKVWVEKSLYGRKYMGIERSTFLIDPHGVVVAQWRKVKVNGHANDVLTQLSTLI